MERLAWIVIAAGLAAATLVFDGSGPIMAANGSAGGMTVGYDRFGRLGAPMQIDVQLLPPGRSSSGATV